MSKTHFFAFNSFSQWTEEDEIADYKKNQDWMDECMDGMFEKWYDKIDEEGSMEDRRKVHNGLLCFPSLTTVQYPTDKIFKENLLYYLQEKDVE